MDLIHDENSIQEQLTLNSIYLCLSEAPSSNFDADDYIDFIFDAIETSFNQKEKMIETEVLMQQPTLINNKFVELLKFCKQNNKRFNPAYVFVGYCDYFELDFCKVFNVLHPKAQNIIKLYAKNIIGEELYNQNEKKNSQSDKCFVPSIFQITQHKQ